MLSTTAFRVNLETRWACRRSMPAGINSRVRSYDAVRFLRRSAEARPLLAEIPDRARLEDGSRHRLRLLPSLLTSLQREFQIGRAKATKVLHKKRPEFIPVIDSVVCDFLHRNFPHLLGEKPRTTDVLSLYKMLLEARSDALGRVQATLAQRGFALSTVRILDFLIWLGWRESGWVSLPQTYP